MQKVFDLFKNHYRSQSHKAPWDHALEADDSGLCLGQFHRPLEFLGDAVVKALRCDVLINEMFSQSSASLMGLRALMLMPVLLLIPLTICQRWIQLTPKL